jgi:transcriptional regulator with XRE-family HTH domain
MRSTKYLDEIKKRFEIKEDKDLASKLGWSPTAVSRYYSGKRIMDEEQCLRVAQTLGMENPLPIIAAAGIDRAEKTGQRSLWEVFTKATSLSPLAVALLVGVTSIVTPTPAEATPDVIQQVNEYVLC